MARGLAALAAVTLLLAPAAMAQSGGTLFSTKFDSCAACKLLAGKLTQYIQAGSISTSSATTKSLDAVLGEYPVCVGPCATLLQSMSVKLIPTITSDVNAGKPVDTTAACSSYCSSSTSAMSSSWFLSNDDEVDTSLSSGASSSVDGLFGGGRERRDLQGSFLDMDDDTVSKGLILLRAAAAKQMAALSTLHPTISIADGKTTGKCYMDIEVGQFTCTVTPGHTHVSLEGHAGTPSASSSHTQGSDSLSGGAVAGIVVGIMALVAVAVGVAVRARGPAAAPRHTLLPVSEEAE